MSYSWKPLSPEASTFSPHTHTHTHTTSYANIGNLLHIRGNQTIKIPLQCTGSESDTGSEGSGGALEGAAGAAVDLPGLSGTSSRIMTSSVCVP